MPTYLSESGRTEWYPDTIERKAAVDPGTLQTQKEKIEIRREKTVLSTARALKIAEEENTPKEELERIILKNAECVAMQPEKLKSLAEEHNRIQEEQLISIEKE